MSRENLSHELLLALARHFEAGGAVWYRPARDGEEIQMWLSELVDEGSVVREGADAFQFSIIGYARYLQRINALRQSRLRDRQAPNNLSMRMAKNRLTPTGLLMEGDYT